ncbi:MAG: ATP-binding cassette domain-containing protein [Rhizobiales bacterium]|nr:ATP-binding cassette domain-containing protein [Hyphomicrobiales bacterium]
MPAKGWDMHERDSMLTRAIRSVPEGGSSSAPASRATDVAEPPGAVTTLEFRTDEAIRARHYGARLFAPGRLTIAHGRRTAILGPSGSGKSTLLRALAGLLDITGWAIEHGRDGHARIALMEQSASLLPWLDVAGNISIGARLRGVPINHRRRDELLRRIGLSEVAAAPPETLSGGMRQRVSLARALYEQADLLLLDEPFTSLDAITRRRMQDLVAAESTGRTLVIVTHDPDEALRLGERIVLLEGTPARIVTLEPGVTLDDLWQRMLTGEPASPASPRAHHADRPQSAARL